MLNDEQLKHYNELLSKYKNETLLGLLRKCNTDMSELIKIHDELGELSYYVTIGELEGTEELKRDLSIFENEVGKTLLARLKGYYMTSHKGN